MPHLLLQSCATAVSQSLPTSIPRPGRHAGITKMCKSACARLIFTLACKSQDAAHTISALSAQSSLKMAVPQQHFLKKALETAE